MRKLLLAAFAVVLMAGMAAQAGQIRVSVVLKALDSEFWRSVESGALAAAKENPDIVLSILAPAREINVQEQVQIVEDIIAKGTDVLVLAPCGGQELAPSMDLSLNSGVPVVLIDTPSPWGKEATFVGTNNVSGGKLAGEFIARKLNGQGEVAFITGVMGHQTHIDRLAGAEQELKKHPGIKIVATQPADSERSKGMTVAENILTTYPNVKAIFCTNDEMALGALEAATAEGAKVVIVGFDANGEAVRSVKSGGLGGTVAQSSFNIGKYGVESAVKVFKGGKLPPHVDTGTTLVSSENADQFLN
ncbi:MAG: sugar ABC transporter substrate-binding protein [Planctomycetota bacterium]|jgi:ribose transport system substrate-binding protein|nr:sugar ABC transporter substrate-binding protein [Planctomycetota bacterium]